MRTGGARGARILALICVAGCQQAPEQPAESEMRKATKVVEGPAQVCASRAVFEIIKNKVFDDAVSKVADEMVKLNGLREAIAGRLENPVLGGYDADLGKTSCAGRIVLGLPPNTQRAFNGATQLFADVTFTVQPAADKSGQVVETIGAEQLVDSLVAGAKMKRSVSPSQSSSLPPEREVHSAGFEGVFDPPPISTADPMNNGIGVTAKAKPSFACGKSLSRVEKMICDDDILADQDNGMASAHRDAKGRTPPEKLAELTALNAKYRARRDRCGDSACISATYDAWTGALYEWQP